MKAKYDIKNNIVTLGDGDTLLESLYDDIKKPVFIDVIYKMSYKIGTFKKTGEQYLPTDQTCQNLSLLATLNLK